MWHYTPDRKTQSDTAMKTTTDLAPELACHLTSFAACADMDAKAAGLLLPPRLWALARATAEPATAAALAQKTGMPAAAALAGLRLLETRGLVSEYLIPLATPAESKAEASASPDKTTDAVVAPVEAAPTPLVATAETQPQAPSENKPSAPAPVVRLSLKAARAKPASAAVVRFSLKGKGPGTPAGTAGREASRPESGGNTPSASPAGAHQTKAELVPSAEGWRIQPVLDALAAKAGGDPMVGQLLAYRVFLRVPCDLLQQAGIRSVCLIEPDLRITNAVLKQSIEQALKDVAGIAWPETEKAAA